MSSNLEQCPHCGVALQPVSPNKFCSGCGKQLKADEPATSAIQQPPHNPTPQTWERCPHCGAEYRRVFGSWTPLCNCAERLEDQPAASSPSTDSIQQSPINPATEEKSVSEQPTGHVADETQNIVAVPLLIAIIIFVGYALYFLYGSIEILMPYAFWGIIGGVIGAVIFSSRKQFPLVSFLLGVLLGPILIWLCLLIEHKGVRTCPFCSSQINELAKVCPRCQKELPYKGMRKCPFCAETVKEEAKVCRYCQRDLPAIAPSSPLPANGRAEDAAALSAPANNDPKGSNGWSCSLICLPGIVTLVVIGSAAWQGYHQAWKQPFEDRGRGNPSVGVPTNKSFDRPFQEYHESQPRIARPSIPPPEKITRLNADSEKTIDHEAAARDFSLDGVSFSTSQEELSRVIPWAKKEASDGGFVSGKFVTYHWGQNSVEYFIRSGWGHTPIQDKDSSVFRMSVRFDDEKKWDDLVLKYTKEFGVPKTARNWDQSQLVGYYWDFPNAHRRITLDGTIVGALYRQPPFHLRVTAMTTNGG